MLKTHKKVKKIKPNNVACLGLTVIVCHVEYMTSLLTQWKDLRNIFVHNT